MRSMPLFQSKAAPVLCLANEGDIKVRPVASKGLARKRGIRHMPPMTLISSRLSIALSFSLAVGGVAACGPVGEGSPNAPEPEMPAEDAGVEALIPPAECGAAFPGPPPSNVVDLQAGYEADAAAARAAADVVYPVNLSEVPSFQRATINFMLGRTGGETIDESDVVAAGELGAAVAVAIAAGGGSEVDFIMLRRGLAHSYLCARPLPASLDELVEHFGDFTAWESTFEVGCSRAKNEARRIYEHPEGDLYVAETVDAEGTVRETEVLFRATRDDGHLDFAAYTADGVITDRSSFATPSSTLVLASPYTCLTCHVDMEAERMDVVDATGTGAGCQ